MAPFSKNPPHIRTPYGKHGRNAECVSYYCKDTAIRSRGYPLLQDYLKSHKSNKWSWSLLIEEHSHLGPKGTDIGHLSAKGLWGKVKKSMAKLQSQYAHFNQDFESHSNLHIYSPSSLCQNHSKFPWKERITYSRHINFSFFVPSVLAYPFRSLAGRQHQKIWVENGEILVLFSTCTFQLSMETGP